ncbi:DUF6544 family protein [Pedococcus bigeumensis]|uniref:DUF6544 family protein n=1 Tax=Pedococcus bigeumensis TaxID=433644 RepID=UPI003CC81165
MPFGGMAGPLARPGRAGRTQPLDTIKSRHCLRSGRGWRDVRLRWSWSWPLRTRSHQFHQPASTRNGVRQASQALSAVDRRPALVSEADLADLPAPVAAHLRRSGAVGQPRVTSFAASFHGRIRSGPAEPWMPFTGRQVNTYGPRPQRAFIMDATRSGLPVTVLHQFIGASATMRAKVMSMVPVVDAAGPEMDQGETVTVFNDLVVFAPGAILDAPIRWTALDSTHVRGVFTNGGRSVTAVLTFDSDHRLVDFTSLDRLRASTDGRPFTALPWSTPTLRSPGLRGYLLPQLGEARWDASPPEGSFSYVELELDDSATTSGTSAASPQAGWRPCTGVSTSCRHPLCHDRAARGASPCGPPLRCGPVLAPTGLQGGRVVRPGQRSSVRGDRRDAQWPAAVGPLPLRLGGARGRSRLGNRDDPGVGGCRPRQGEPSAKAASAWRSWVAPACSATSSGAGATERSRTSPRPSRALAG